MDRVEIKEVLTKLMNDLLENDYIEIKDFKEKHKILLALELSMYGSSTVPWSLEEEKQLKAELLEGMELEEIAEIHNRTKLAVKKRIGDLGLNAESKPKNTEHAGGCWTVEEEERLIKEVMSFKDIKEIANDHNRTVGAIKSRLKMLNITSN